MLLFLVLNLLATAAGAGLEYWRSQPRALPAFNADKIKLRGVGEADFDKRKVNHRPAKASAPEYLPPDP